jgi:hypothetical protein
MRRRWLLAVVDGIALLSFVLAGIREHGETEAGSVLLRNAVPLLVVWFLLSFPLRTYREPGLRTLLRTWISAVPVALLIRTLWVGDPTGARIVIFLGVGLAFTLLFLVIGRSLIRILPGPDANGAASGVVP